MSINCNVIKDIMPLYIDQLCSVETVQLVDEHLKSCKDCRETLDVMRSNFETSLTLDKEELKKSRRPFKKIRDQFIWWCICLLLLTAVITTLTQPLFSLIFIGILIILTPIWLIRRTAKSSQRETFMDKAGFALGLGWLGRTHELEPKSRLHEKKSVYFGNWSIKFRTPLLIKIVIIFAAVSISILLLYKVSFYYITEDPFTGRHRISENGEFDSVRILGLYGVDFVKDRVTEISLKNSLPEVEQKVRGIRIRNTYRGDFLLKDAGEARLIVVDCEEPLFIYIHTKDGLIVLNRADMINTRSLYQELLNYLLR